MRIEVDYVNAHIAASAAQALHHQWEVAKLLAWSDASPLPGIRPVGGNRAGV